MQTIIVGNGPIKGKGKEIDAFDNVIRIHNGIDRPECIDDVGEKMTIWGVRLREFSSPRAIEKFKEKHPDVEIWNFNNVHGDLKHYNNNMKKEYGIWPTTGFLCAIKALESFNNVSAIGFGLAEGKKHHFWSDEVYYVGPGERHDSVKEIEIMKKLKVKFLDRGL